MTTEKSAGTAPAAGSSTTNKPAPQKKGGFSAFLATLCCQTPKDANQVGDEGPDEAAKPANRLKSQRQPQKAAAPNDASAAESSTADSKEPDNEKAADSAYAAGAVGPAHDDGDVDRTGGVAGASQTSRQRPDTNKDVPDLPASAQVGQSRLDTNTGTAPGIEVTDPTPIEPPSEDVIHDRSPEQEKLDHELEMTEAGPTVPISKDEVPSEGQSGSGATNRNSIVLPPPPPIEQRQQAIAHQSPDLHPTQKWLLGPLEPRFQGKKCLVLDLDETLVHSSFKVRARTFEGLHPRANIRKDPAPSRLHNTR